jgi:hypothetical protein
MQRPRKNKIRYLPAVLAAALAALCLACFAVGPAVAATASKAAPPATTLGIWTGAEDSGSYSTVGGQDPGIANYYLAWGQQWPATFVSQAEAAGAVPYIEIEGWHAGPQWNQTPSLTSIAAGADSADTDCTLNGSTYGTSCATWLASIGQAIAQLAKPVILGWDHEENVDGQYPWAAGDTGSCGSVSCTPAQWVASWDTVQDAIDGAGAAPYAYWMWAPNADTGGSSQNFTAWWPGASRVDMVGLDGYPQGGAGWGLCNFQELFGQSFAEMRTLTSLPIFISETDLSALSTSQSCNGGSYETITGFINDLFAAGGDGVLQFQDGTTGLSSAQWAELDTALAAHPATATASAPAPAATTTTAAATPAPSSSPAPTATPTPSGTATSTGSGNCAATAAQAGGQAPWAEKRPGQLPAWRARWSRHDGGAQ